IFMVFTHELFNLMGEENYETFPAILLEDSIGSWAHAMFLLIVGASLFLSTQKRKDIGVNPAKHVILRGLFLIGLGFILNIFWNLSSFCIVDIFMIEILVIIGLSIIIVYFLLEKLPLIGKIVIFFIAFSLTPILQNIFLYNGPYAYEMYTEDANGLLAHYLTNGPFPIFPCSTYVMLGFILGEYFLIIKKKQNYNKETQFILFLFIISIPLVIFGYLFDTVDFFWEIFKWEDIYILMFYGMALLFLAIFMVIEKITPENKDYLKPLSEIGIVSLSIFFLDQIVGIIFESFELYPYIPFVFAIIIVSVGIIIMFIMTHIWIKIFKIGPLEWILKKLT
ncbi:MAG: DUF418 domain-containing protein, partial [Candidatus Hermodarchaeota archaeon]